MDFRNFRFQVTIRVIGIGLTMAGFAWSIYKTEFLMTPIVFGLLTLIQMVALIYYSEWTMRELKRFFDSFIDSDYTRRFEPSKKGKVFNDLGNAFNNIINDFKKIRIEKEEHYQYLLQVNKHVNVGLICFTEDGRIDLMNLAACNLLHKPVLDRVEMLRNHDEVFFDAIMALDSGDTTLFKSNFGGQAADLAIAAIKFKLGDQHYTLLSLQNIRSELDQQEMQAWQKLIRVLTHEIMNSVTPVVSLTTAVRKIMEDEQGSPIDVRSLEDERGKDIYKSVNAIESRGKGLLDFVNAYRDYTKMPVPELEQVDMVSQVNEVLQILRESLQQIDVGFKHSVDHYSYALDKNLVDQVLINLIKNAAEALEHSESPRIEIELLEEGPWLIIRDNGPGIPEDILDEIFVPFFTTKAKGNGIGLSLSKQIMKAHGGDILIKSSDAQTTFELRFA